MLIEVEGYLIQTDYIYSVTPVEGNNCWSPAVRNINNEILDHSGYSFTIKFLNDKCIRLSLSDSQVYPDEQGIFSSWWKKDYYSKRDKIKEKVEELRNKIVSVITPTNKDIPSFRFNI